MTAVPPDLPARVRDWIADDPDPGTRAELQRLLDAAPHDARARSDLAARFAGTLRFGTAGLRAPLGAGPTRMNRATVSRTAAGLAGWLADRGGGLLVVGHDARARSEELAHDVAEVASGAGLGVALIPGARPTPVLAFAVRSLGAASGVMVTASHNPATDNGLKVYAADGSQVVPPADTDIAARAAAVHHVRDLVRSSAWTVLDASVVDDYVAKATATVPPGPRELSVVVTALHGVGGALLERVLTGAGFAPPHVVSAQHRPDPRFPTVTFPNPEEPGALDLALALAADVGADLVLALDPDADRCAVAVPTRGARSPGRWRVLTGDEVGCLLGEQVARRPRSPDGASRARPVLATSIVSSTRLSVIARRHGCAFVPTLTGFKWLGRVPGLTYAYEEALGYCLDPRHVADKDGITAALAVAALAAALRAEGRSLLDALDELDTTYGVHATAQVSLRGRVHTAGALRARTTALTEDPPASVGGLPVVAREDLADGVDGLPPTEGLRLLLRGPTADGSARVVVRPSGTEPKLKAYLEVVVPVTPRRPLAAARSLAGPALEQMRGDVMRALRR